MTACDSSRSKRSKLLLTDSLARSVYYVIKCCVYIEARIPSWCRDTKCDCKHDWLLVRSPLGDMKYLFKFIFPFHRSGDKVKQGVDFSHSIRNASRILRKLGNGVSH